MKKKNTVALILLSAIGGFILGRVSLGVPLRMDFRQLLGEAETYLLEPFVRENPGAHAEESELIPLGDAPFLGPGSSPVTLVMFADFQCGYCRRVLPEIYELMEDYGSDDRLRVVFKNFPLFGDLAARGSEAAHMQGQFWSYHDQLFQLDTGSIDEGALVGIAEELSLDVDRFVEDLNSEEIGRSLDASVALGRALEVNGTPTFFINGQRLVGSQPLEIFREKVEEELEAAAALQDSGVPLEALFYRRVQDSFTELPVRDEPETGGRGELELPAADPLDPEGEGVELSVYADFSQSGYFSYGRTIERLYEAFGDQVSVTFYGTGSPLSAGAVMVSAALEEATTQGAQLPFHSALIAERGELDRARLLQIAETIDLDLERFVRAIENPENPVQQTERVENARSRGIVLTPSVIVNEQRFVGVLPYDDLEEIISNLLNPS